MLEEAFRVTHLRTKKDLVNFALKELIRTHKKRNLLELSGKVQLSPEYDYKKTRSNRNVLD